MSDEQRTLGDLSPLELIELAKAATSKAIAEHEQGEPGPACGAYAYLSLAEDKLRKGA